MTWITYDEAKNEREEAIFNEGYGLGKEQGKKDAIIKYVEFIKWLENQGLLDEDIGLFQTTQDKNIYYLKKKELVKK
jgi:hypothetical protein